MGGNGAWGINESGQIGGFSANSSGFLEAFLYSGGTMTGLGDLNPSPAAPFRSSYAYGINGSGQVVGDSHNGSSYEAFLYSGGTMTGLGDLNPNPAAPNRNSRAYGINGSGQVVGSSYNGSTGEAFLYSGGTMTGLGYLNPGTGLNLSIARGINNSGQIVGHSLDSNDFFRGFVYDGGAMYQLDTLLAPSSSGWTISNALAINSKGQIAAIGRTSPGTMRALLLTPTPVPEPDYLVLFGVLVGGVLMLRRRSAAA